MGAEVTGLAELGQALKEFPNVLAAKYLRKATFAGAAVFKSGAIMRAPVKTGAMRDHIAIFKRSADQGTVHYAIGVRGVKLTKKLKKVTKAIRSILDVKRVDVSGDLFYADFIERGTSKMAARPFLRPTLDADSNNAIEAVRTSLADGVQAAAAEVAK